MAKDQEFLPHEPSTKGRGNGQRASSLDSIAGQKLITTPRSQKNKLINQQQMRERVAAQGHLGGIVFCLKRFATIAENARIRKTAMTPGDRDKYSLQMKALDSRIAGHFKMLNKFLPDLKSLALETNEGDDLLASAARAWAKALEVEPD